MYLRKITFSPPKQSIQLAWAAIILGGLAFSIGLLIAPACAWANLLLVGFFGASMGLAGAVFVALQYVTTAGWGVALRRVPEALCGLVPVFALGLAAVFLVYPDMYPWFSQEHHDASFLRALWLDWPFFLMRAAIYVGLWIVLSGALLYHSRRQDGDSLVSHTLANTRLAALFLVVFGITFWLASSDWIMSLEPEWISTVFGLYNFAGLFQSGLAAIILLVLWLRRLGPLRGVVGQQHLHDLGKLLFAFSTFWVYIWFCQYMLIWYVNNPEETPYYIDRLQGAWAPLFWANVVLNWVIPFVVLLPASAKRNVKVLANVAGLVLVGRWLDLFLMIRPDSDGMIPGIVEAGMALGMTGIGYLSICRALSRAALVPVHDPYLVESLPWHGQVSEPARTMQDVSGGFRE